MTITTLSSHAFNQHAGKAKKAAAHGPVFITCRGRPAHVLLTMEHDERLVRRQASIIDMLAVPGAEAVDFEPARVGPLSRPAELS